MSGDGASPGSRTVKTEPLPGSLATVTSPPIMRANLRVMASPSPVPPKRCAVVASAWLNSSNSFACCSAVMPMPVSETDSSAQSRPLPTLLARSLTSPSFVNLQALLRRFEQNLPQPHGVHGDGAEILLSVDDKAVLVLLGELACGADDLVDQRSELHRLRIELELAGLYLGEIEHLVDQAEQMDPGAMHALQRLGGLLSTETGRVGHHHLGQPNDGVERVRSSWLMLVTNCDLYSLASCSCRFFS